MTKRKALLAELFPWDEPNYGIDERWIRFYPYGRKAAPGQTVRISLKVFNHSNVAHTFSASLNPPAGFDAVPGTASATVPPRTERQLNFELSVGASAETGTHVVTADVEWAQWSLPRWIEAIIEVE
ncbi:MAG: COG1470 family protein [Planctomycetota bacterium]